MDEMTAMLREMTRTDIGDIWQLHKEGQILDGEEERLRKILAEHKEYYKYWDMADDLGDKEIVVEGVNPFLHVYFHLTVENQIGENDPAIVKETVERLQNKGINRHELIHRVAEALSRQIFNILKHKVLFNEKEYVKDIKNIEKAY